jgi:ribosomal-protein-alanine N-acetyltransferase
MTRFSPIETERLTLRPPEPLDAPAMFDISSSAAVTRFMAWPRHVSLDDTREFLAVSQCEWDRWPAGPLLIVRRADKAVIGSCGLAFETPYRASTGYVLAQRAWGQGFASEALRATMDLAKALRVRRLYAHCHVEHAASARVLARAGFELEGTLRKYLVFPNLQRDDPQDVFTYARTE